MQTFPANPLIRNGCQTEKPANSRRRARNLASDCQFLKLSSPPSLAARSVVDACNQNGVDVLCSANAKMHKMRSRGG